MHKGYVVLTLAFEKEGRRWIARCVELSTGTFGRSLSEAEKRIKEAVLLHLNTLEDVGEIERFFKEHSIKFHRTRPTKDLNIRVPIRRETFYRPYIQQIPALVS